MPKTFKPQLATPVDEPPKGKEWLHEIKLDGYRTIALVADGKTKLLTRNGHDWTDRYGDIAAAFNALPCKDAVIDGEIVVPDEQGATRFGALQDAIANGDTSQHDLLRLRPPVPERLRHFRRAARPAEGAARKAARVGGA